MTDEIEGALAAVGDAVDDVHDALRSAWEQGIEGRLAAVEEHTHDTEHTHAEFAGTEHTHDTTHTHADEYASADHEHERASVESSGNDGVADSDDSVTASSEIKPDRGSHEEREKVPHRTHFLFKRVGRR